MSVIALKLPAGWDVKKATTIDAAQLQKHCLAVVDAVKTSIEEVSADVLVLDQSGDDFDQMNNKTVVIDRISGSGGYTKYDADLQFDSTKNEVLSGEVVLKSGVDLYRRKAELLSDGGIWFTSTFESPKMRTEEQVWMTPDGRLQLRGNSCNEK